MITLGTEDQNSSCPEDMVLTHDEKSCIDIYEWPNVKGQKPLLGLSATPSDSDIKKGVMMNAKDLCASVGKRMCSLDEWVSSCKGKGGSDYPFGQKLPKIKPTPDEAKCNYAQEFKKPDEYKVWLRDEEEMERLNQSDPAGSRKCVSRTGAEDMMGNAEEWIVCPSYLSTSCKDGICYCLAGRYWSDPAMCHRVVTSHAPDWHYYQSGTRCCLSLDN